MMKTLIFLLLLITSAAAIEMPDPRLEELRNRCTGYNAAGNMIDLDASNKACLDSTKLMEDLKKRGYCIYGKHGTYIAKKNSARWAPICGSASRCNQANGCISLKIFND
jgi:hypothetical protein